jgi:hypothetical protein
MRVLPLLQVGVRFAGAMTINSRDGSLGGLDLGKLFFKLLQLFIFVDDIAGVSNRCPDFIGLVGSAAFDPIFQCGNL